MKIIGWIREGDKAACGGTVAEGENSFISMGRAVAVQRARMACQKNCVIAEGVERDKAMGRSMVHHGMKTSGGCPLISTVNDINGVGNASGAAIPSSFIQDHIGQWVGNSAGVSSSVRQAYDEQFQLFGGDGRPLSDTYYTAKLASGELVHGETDDEGKTQRFYTTGAHHIEIHLGHLNG